MARGEKSYFPRLGQSWPLSVRARRCDSSARNSYEYGSYIVNISRFDSRAEKSEAWLGLRAFLNPNGGNEGIPMATKLSARNQIEGNIVELEVDGVMAHVTVQVGKNLIESVITRRSAEEMKLKVGDRVSAVIKSTEVMLQKG
jgi:molybdopterin-binding protein